MDTGLIFAAAFCAGRKHDFQLFRESEIKLPPQVVLLADAGYQGVAEIHPNSQTPFKVKNNLLLAYQRSVPGPLALPSTQPPDQLTDSSGRGKGFLI